MCDLFLGTVRRNAWRALARHVRPTTDDRLLDRSVRDRDESAFAELVAWHGPGVWSAALKPAKKE